MKCRQLSGSRILSCAANRFVYIPTLSELEKYCMTSRHDRCPHLPHQLQENEAGQLSQNNRAQTTKK